VLFRSMAALESLAADIPLVGSHIGGIPEIIVEGETGFTTAPKDPASILTGLLKASKLKVANGASRRWAEKNASRSDHMATLEQILKNANQSTA